MKNFIFFLFVVLGIVSSAINIANAQTSDAPQFSLASTPTIAKHLVAGIIPDLYEYKATFNLRITAGSSDVQFGMPGAGTSALITSYGAGIYKNGVLDTASNYNTVYQWTVPEGTIPAASANRFAIAAGQTVTIPIVFAFTVQGPGSNVYAVQLLSLKWAFNTSNALLQVSAFDSNPNWRTQSNNDSCYQFNTDMTIGSSGADVIALQTFLISNGYDIPSVSSGTISKGYFGQETANAVIKYQMGYGILPASGYVGPITRAGLNSCSAGTGTVRPAGTYATLSIDSGTPISKTVAVTDTSNNSYVQLPVLVFDLGAATNTILRSVNINLPVTGVGKVTAAYLFNGSVQLASATVANGVAQFTNIDTNIPYNTVKAFTVRIDVVNVGSPNLTITPSTAGVTIQDINGNNLGVAGVANGYPVTIVASGPIFSLAGQPIWSVHQDSIDQYGYITNTYSATFSINVTAVGEDVGFGLPSNSYPAFTSTTTTAAACKNGIYYAPSNMVVSYVPPSGASVSSDGTYFLVKNDQSFTIPVTFTFSKRDLGSTNSYGISLRGVNWFAGKPFPVPSIYKFFPPLPAGAGGCDATVPIDSFISLTYPAGGPDGSPWTRGSTQTIKWWAPVDMSKTYNTSQVDIYLLHQDIYNNIYLPVHKYTIAKGVINPANYPWVVGSVMPEGTSTPYLTDGFSSLAVCYKDTAICSSYNSVNIKTPPPVISYVTSPISGGQKMSIGGKNLNSANSFGNVYIDGINVTSRNVLVDGSKTATVLFFVLPALTNGQHLIQVTTDHGMSNAMNFQVNASTSVAIDSPAPQVPAPYQAPTYYPNPTYTPTYTPTPAPTLVPVSTPTYSPTPTPTYTPTATPTPTSSPTSYSGSDDWFSALILKSFGRYAPARR